MKIKDYDVNNRVFNSRIVHYCYFTLTVARNYVRGKTEISERW